MKPELALILCIIFVLSLLRIERKKNPSASHALWIPTAWFLICASRPVASWFNFRSVAGAIQNDVEGSAIDRLILSALILLALFVISRRKIDWYLVFKTNTCLFVVYMLVGLSIIWADYPYISFKRWMKISGAIVMATFFLSEREPLMALESTFIRTAFILIPFSLLIIKYYPHLGVMYGRWDGSQMWVGVSGQKNGLGLLCALSAFILIWVNLRTWQAGEFFKNRTQSFAVILVLSMAVYLLIGSDTYSATSVVILIVALACLVVLNHSEDGTKWIVFNLKFLIVGLGIIYVIINNVFLPYVSVLLGRDPSLTGRTEIWKELLVAAWNNPYLGVGFGSFWVETETILEYGVKQSHNGYIDVFLDLGIFGIILIIMLLFSFCNIIKKEYDDLYEFGILGICFLPIVVLYNISESTFFQPTYLWTTFVFLTVVLSTPSFKKANEAPYFIQVDYSRGGQDVG